MRSVCALGLNLVCAVMAQPAGRKYSPEDFQGMLKEVQGSLKTGDAKLTTQVSGALDRLARTV